jgi:4-hydroxy-2-oxoheptanedioate aldolase
MRASDGTPPDAATFEATLKRINEACHRNNVPSGLHVQTAEQALNRAEEGWQFIAVASELKFMLDGIAKLASDVHPELAKSDLARY